MYKYLLKAFYNKTNKKEYNLQIQQYNIYHINIIATKNVIIVTKKGRENRRPMVIENTNKTAKAKVAKVLNAIDLDNKYNQIINNIDINTAGNLELTSTKKYQKYVGQI